MSFIIIYRSILFTAYAVFVISLFLPLFVFERTALGCPPALFAFIFFVFCVDYIFCYFKRKISDFF